MEDLIAGGSSNMVGRERCALLFRLDCIAFRVACLLAGKWAKTDCGPALLTLADFGFEGAMTLLADG